MKKQSQPKRQLKNNYRILNIRTEKYYGSLISPDEPYTFTVDEKTAKEYLKYAFFLQRMRIPDLIFEEMILEEVK